MRAEVGPDDPVNIRLSRWKQQDYSARMAQTPDEMADSLDDLRRRFDRGDFDLVAVGRALISDPDWALKVRDGRNSELSDFSPAALGSLV